MEKILQEVQGIVIYLDDILVTGKNKEEHLQNLEAVFTRLIEHGLKLKKKKCFFMKSQVEYLGYVVNAQGVYTAPQKVAAVAKAPVPSNVKEFRSFLGLVTYYKSFFRIWHH